MDVKIFLGVVLLAVAANCTTTKDAHVGVYDALYQQLFTHYNKDVKPDNVTVKYGIALLDVDFDVTRNRMISTIWERVVWKDNRLSWSEADFNISVFRLPSNLFWKPDVVIYNGKQLSTVTTNALLYPSGEILMVPPSEFESRCDLTPLLKDENAEQVCRLKFGSWTFDGYKMDLQLYNSVEKADLEDYSGVKFNVTKNIAKRNVKKYSCCEEPYIDIEYELGFTRNPATISNSIYNPSFDSYRYNSDVQLKLRKY
jgi:hypothetical protein